MSNVQTLRKDAPQEAPNNIQAEQQLLGAILINNDAFYRVADFLKAENFYDPAHQRIFEVCAGLIRSGKLCTPVTLKTLLPQNVDIGGMTLNAYLARLATNATTIINAPEYARVVREMADRRRLLDISEELAKRAMDSQSGEPAATIIEDTEADLLDLTHIESSKGGFMRFSDAAREAIDLASAAYQRDGGLSGLSTGLRDIDAMTGGLQRSDMVVLAGRPGMGKSALAMNIAYNVASRYRGQPAPDGTVKTVDGGVVGFFSLEMSGEQLATRVISDKAEVPSSRIRRGEISEAEFEHIAGWATANRDIPLYINESGGLSIAQVTSHARRLKRQRGLDLIVVDYIQLMCGTSRKAMSNRVQEITEITMGLKALAKELDVPILALSQLSREVERRDDKRPMLADLRDSGSIEQDADVVMFVYREEYYLLKREPKEAGDEWMQWEAKLREHENRADIIIGKQRHGPEGTVKLHFDAKFTRFSDLAREQPAPARTAEIIPFDERGI